MDAVCWEDIIRLKYYSWINVLKRDGFVHCSGSGSSDTRRNRSRQSIDLSKRGELDWECGSRWPTIPPLA